MTATIGWRGLSGRAAEECELAERQQMKQHLARHLSRTVADVEREIQFQRRGLPASVPLWAQGLAGDRTVTNLKTVLKGACLTAMIRDEKHASRHQERRFWCPHCIAKDLGGANV